jgi:hypothetical protein
MKKEEMLQKMRSAHHSKKLTSAKNVADYGFSTLMLLLTYISRTFKTLVVPNDVGDGVRGVTLYLYSKTGEAIERINIPKASSGFHGYGYGMPQKCKLTAVYDHAAFLPVVLQHKGKYEFSENWDVLFSYLIFKYVPESEQETVLRKFSFIQ